MIPFSDKKRIHLYWISPDFSPVHWLEMNTYSRFAMNSNAMLLRSLGASPYELSTKGYQFIYYKDALISSRHWNYVVVPNLELAFESLEDYFRLTRKMAQASKHLMLFITVSPIKIQQDRLVAYSHWAETRMEAEVHYLAGSSVIEISPLSVRQGVLVDWVVPPGSSLPYYAEYLLEMNRKGFSI